MDVLYSVPIALPTNNCPCCYKELTERKFSKIIIYNPSQKARYPIKRQLFHCATCNVLYGDKTFVREIEYNYYGFKPNVFYPRHSYKTNTPSYCLDQMHKLPKEYSDFTIQSAPISKSQKKPSYKKLPDMKPSYKKHYDIKKIFCINNQVAMCPVCNSDYVETNIIVQPTKNCELNEVFVCINNNHYLIKDIAFTNNTKHQVDLPDSTEYDKSYYIKDLSTLINYYDDIDQAACLLVLRSNSTGKIISKIIAMSENPSKNILSYRNKNERLLLTQIIHDKKRTVIIAQEEYSLLFSKTKNTSLCDEEIYIKSGGGLKNHLIKNQEIVDILLYSPFTKCYEILHATYDKFEDIVFVDAGVYRRFIETYGTPKLTVIPLSDRTWYSDSLLDSLNSESLLHEFGYTVNKKDRLTERERRNILSFLMDADIMTQKEILNLLYSFISLHSSDIYEDARSLWNKDIKFVTDYKADPTRFLILNTKR